MPIATIGRVHQRRAEVSPTLSASPRKIWAYRLKSRCSGIQRSGVVIRSRCGEMLATTIHTNGARMRTRRHRGEVDEDRVAGRALHSRLISDRRSILR